jgi:L,D-transpeptidase catalytic domain.
MAIVSIKSQKVTIYDADGWVLRAPVSSGTAGRETPAGVFSVVEKDKDHRSSLYDDAWMPHMLRITWNGDRAARRAVARICGLARLRADALWLCGEAVRQSPIGTRVIISPSDAEPVEFSHPTLFVPKSAGHRGRAGARRNARPRGGRGHQAGSTDEERCRPCGEGGGPAHGGAAQA